MSDPTDWKYSISPCSLKKDIASQVYADSQERIPLLQQLYSYGQVENFECRTLRSNGEVF